MKKSVLSFLAAEAVMILLLTPHLLLADPWDDLYKAARQEGKVFWQIGVQTEEYIPVIEAFEKRYPGIKVTPVRSTGPAMIPRLITESSAGNVSVDAAFASFLWIKPLLDRDLLAREDWKKYPNIDRNALLLDGRLLTQYGFTNVTIYNKNLVPASKVPKSWEDLLNPQWQGQICVPLTVVGCSVVFDIWDEGRAVKYLEALAKQKLIAESGANMTAPRCANGEVALADTTTTMIPGMRNQGLPIGVAPISPQWDSPFGLYSIKGAPHPNAAKLLMAWLITADGRAIMRKIGRGPNFPCDASPQAQILCENGIKVITLDTVEKAVRQEGLLDRTRKILGLKPPN